jgi:ubiquinone biosynthesis protein
MTRLRETGWAMALLAVLLVLSFFSNLGDASQECKPPLNCDPALIGAVLAIALSIVWLLLSLVLLATNPRGAVRAFLVQVMVNVLSLTVALWLLGIIQLPVTGPDGSREYIPLLSVPSDLLVVAILFAIANALIRPILFAVFGRLILRTVGLAVILVNALLFLIVAELSARVDKAWVVPDPWLFWLFVDSVVVTAVISVFNAFLGLDRPRLDAGDNDRIWRFIERLPARRRNALFESIRMQEVYDTMSSYGIEIVAGRTPLAPIRRMGDRMRGRANSELNELTTPAKVRLMLQQLGPTFVKVGQMASSRADALQEDWRAELDKLQSTVAPFPWEDVRQIIARELRADPETLFASIEHQPLGAASLAQVHRATLNDGRQVVIKVQRPDVQAKVRADLGVIQELAAVAEARVAVARQMDVTGLAKEFADGVVEELDYRIEAYHARRLADVLKGIPGTHVPAVHTELSTDRVLTMEFIPGVKATRADQLDASIDREELARTFIRALIKQVMVDGFFHADPHPGNILVDPHTGVITFLDLGLVGEIAQQQRIDLFALLWALRSSDSNALATVSLRLCVPVEGLDENAYRTDVDRLFHRYWVYGDAEFGGMVNALFATLREHGLRMRKELTLAVKAMTQAEELLRAVNPGLQLVDVATQEAEGILRAELTPERIGRYLQGQAGALIQEAISSANMRSTQLGPAVLALVTGGRLGGWPQRSEAQDLAPLSASLDRLDEGLERLGRRSAVATGAAGVAVGLSVITGALVLNPDVTFDGPVLVVGALAGTSLVLLAWRTFVDRVRG